CSSGLSVPFLVYGGRVSSAGGGHVSGSVSRSGGVAVAGSVGASHASGGGGLVGTYGSGRAGGLLPGGRCAGPRAAGRCESKKPPNCGGPPEHPTGRLHSMIGGESARRQHHHDLAALELRVLLHLGVLGDVGLHLVEQLGADLLVCHFAATVAQGDLHLVAFLEEALHRAHLHVIVKV